MIKRIEIENLAVLLSRAGMTYPETAWANELLNRLRGLADAIANEQAKEPETENET